MKVGSTVAAKAGVDAPGGGISLCFCRRGCAAPAQRPPRSPALAASPATLSDPRRIILTLNAAQRPCAVIAKKIETNLSEDILVSVYYVRWSCVWNRLIARTGGLPPSLRSGRLRPERQVLQERLALQVLQERPCLQELRRLGLLERQQGLRRRPERVRVRFSRRGCRCTSGR